MKFLLIDNYDSFTYMLADYIRQSGVACEVQRNDAAILDRESYLGEFDALVLSPGPETPAKAGKMMHLLGTCYREKPVLGICLGHQAIGEFFGARLIKAGVPQHGKVSVVKQTLEHAIWKKVPARFTVTRYHSLLLEQVTEPLRILAQTDEGEVMAIAHRQLPLVGIQFHPESCLTPHGLQIIKNYTEMVAQQIIS